MRRKKRPKNKLKKRINEKIILDRDFFILNIGRKTYNIPFSFYQLFNNSFKERKQKKIAKKMGLDLTGICYIEGNCPNCKYSGIEEEAEKNRLYYETILNLQKFFCKYENKEIEILRRYIDPEENRAFALKKSLCIEEIILIKILQKKGLLRKFKKKNFFSLKEFIKNKDSCEIKIEHKQKVTLVSKKDETLKAEKQYNLFFGGKNEKCT